MRRVRRIGPILMALVLVSSALGLVDGAITAGPAHAQATDQGVPGAVVPLVAGPSIGHSFVPPPPPRGEVGTETANIVVSYSGFSAAAQTAFQFAVDQWEQLITSPVTININASWATLGTNVLGQAGTTVFLSNSCAAMTSQTLYAVALANALCGTDLRPGEEDGDATFNSAFSGWYFGTDGNPPSNQYDFVSVVMHELGHALGFLGSMQVSGSTGSWGLGTGKPAKYDRFTENGSNQALLSFPNNSSALASQLQSGSVYFDGPQTTAADGGTPARLYAPNPWQSGSSYSHLDDATYPAGNPNSMMTPVLNGGEAVHTPGPVGVGIMYDQGWTFAPPTAPSAPQGVAASAGNQLATVSWSLPASDSGAAITSYTVTSSPGNKTCTWTTGPLSCTVIGLANATPYTFTVVATNSIGNGPASSPSAAVTPGAGAGTLTPLTPARILDTRTNVGLSGAFGSNQVRDLTVEGVGGVPASGVDAVIMNVTVTNTTAAGYLTLFPTGAVLPLASNLNFVAGQTVPNLVVVKIGDGGANEGKVSILNSAGTTDVVADVMGYYRDASAAAADRFTGLTPNRILDTRVNTGLSGAFTANQIRDLTVTGAGVPATADAIVMNVTVTQPSTTGYLTLFPAGGALPLASNLNFVANQTVPNLVVVKIAHGGANEGKVSIANGSTGTVHVIADVVGYDDTSGGSSSMSIAPARVVDTRSGNPISANGALTVTPGAGAPLPPVGSYSAVVANVTVTVPTQAGYLTVYPSDASLPLASNLNFVAGQTVPNLVMVRVGVDGKFKITNGSSGTVHVVVDIVGFYT